MGNDAFTRSNGGTSPDPRRLAVIVAVGVQPATLVGRYLR